MGATIGTIISFIVGLPLLLTFLFWSASSIISPSAESIGKGAELVAYAAVPWWIDVLGWLAPFPFLVLGFILFLIWIKAI